MFFSHLGLGEATPLEKAALISARSELTRILANIERALENKPLFQVELAKALRLVEPVYLRTKDAELRSLLNIAETHLQE